MGDTLIISTDDKDFENFLRKPDTKGARQSFRLSQSDSVINEFFTRQP